MGTIHTYLFYFTLTLVLPEIDLFELSVIVMVWLPVALNVTVKLCTPVVTSGKDVIGRQLGVPIRAGEAP